MLNIVSYNIEGLKGNAHYLKRLQSDHSIICLQEHWLHGYETNEVKKLLPDHDFHISCYDDDNIEVELYPRRGKSGLLILWPKVFSHKIKKLEKEERILAIEIQTDSHNLILINNYLPTMMTGSESNYREHLDKLSILIEKYESTHDIVLAGDMNGSVNPIRNNTHDKLLKEFCRKNHFNHAIVDVNRPTFYHHNGKSTSQIDYIMEKANKNILRKTYIADQNQLNSSSHVPVITDTSLVISSGKQKHISNSAKSILKWEETDITKYQNCITDYQQKHPNSDFTDLEEQAANLINALQNASDTCVKKKIVNLKGPNRKASDKVKDLMSKSKRAFYNWKQSGRPRTDDNQLYNNMKKCKRELRQQMRREELMDKQKFYNNLMDNPDTKTFHRLIRKHKSQPNSTSTMIIKDQNGDEIIDHVKQSEIFAEFYEDLATPSNADQFDNVFLEECEMRYNLINNIVNNQTIQDELTKFSPLEIKNAIDKLNTGKASDGYGLSTEHFKNAGETILSELANFFNNIMATGKVPSFFKTGILTPVHKKLKDPTLTTNYRGITVTSVLGKIFEYALLEKMPNLNKDQSDLQFGFTKGLSPIMAALIVSEGILHAKQQNKDLYLVTLDSQKAFDVVNHMILLEKLYFEVPADVWKVVQDLYTNMSTQVKWNGHTSKKFRMQQGVRQGGILSTHLYKLYINDLPTELEKRALGLSIGLEYCGSPLCADDIVLMSTDETEIQAMLDIAYKFSCQHRYNIHPQKSNIVKLDRSNKGNVEQMINLGNEPLQKSLQTTHLGIIRAKKHEGKINIQEHISNAR